MYFFMIDYSKKKHLTSIFCTIEYELSLKKNMCYDYFTKCFNLLTIKSLQNKK